MFSLFCFFSRRSMESKNCCQPFFYILKCLDSFFLYFGIGRYPYLKKIDNIYIELKTRNIEMRIDKEYVHPVTFSMLRIDLEKIFLGEIFKIEGICLDETIKILDKNEKRSGLQYCRCRRT